MIIERHNETLCVKSNIHFDYSESFCGRPYVTLLAHKKPINHWNEYSIAIGIRDDDDFDIGLVYETDKEHFEDVLHELINWMRDHEQGISCCDELSDKMNFFPDCLCERKRW